MTTGGRSESASATRPGCSATAGRRVLDVSLVSQVNCRSVCVSVCLAKCLFNLISFRPMLESVALYLSVDLFLFLLYVSADLSV